MIFLEKKRIIIALGGNAILTKDPTAEGQMKALTNTSKYLVKMIEAGHEVIITHGNGPQVGNLLLQQSAAKSEKNPEMPIDTAVAMTQGSIGYWLQKALKKELLVNGIDKEVVTIITQVEVSRDDPAFKEPSKPIGPFYTEEEAKLEEDKTGHKFIEDSGRGYRRVVPSPKPVRIIEYATVKALVESGNIPISVGGGGIPVVKSEFGYRGIEAVIDKDYASSNLGCLIDADYLIILTDVDNVFINYNKSNQRKLCRVSTSELENYIEQNQFASGSMLPKIEASIQFVKNSKKEAKAIITSLTNLPNAFIEDMATVIEND